MHEHINIDSTCEIQMTNLIYKHHIKIGIKSVTNYQEYSLFDDFLSNTSIYTDIEFRQNFAKFQHLTFEREKGYLKAIKHH